MSGEHGRITVDMCRMFWIDCGKRGKFSRSAWEFDVVLNSRQKEIP